MTDFQFIQWYRKGWYDAKVYALSFPPKEAQTAYEAGMEMYYTMLGATTLQFTDEEILKRIKE